MIRSLFFSAAALCLLAVLEASAAEVREGDAFARADVTKQTWTIGAKAVQMMYAFVDGQFRLVSLRNNAATPAREYAAPSAPFGVEPPVMTPFTFEAAWSAQLDAGKSADPASAALRLNVKVGDLVGFKVATYSDDTGATVNWATTLDYGDGTKYSSLDDGELAGPVWQYFTLDSGAGCMDVLGEVVQPAEPGQPKVRAPNGYRAPAECSSLGAAAFHLTNAFGLVRVWKAPKDGVVTVRGAAENAANSSKVFVEVIRISDRSGQPNVALGSEHWAVESSMVRKVAVGGRPAVQLDLELNREGLRAHLHVQAYPGTSVLRQWVEFENATTAAMTLPSPTSLNIGLRRDDAAPITNYWMCGGTSRPNQGQLESAEAGASYHRALLGDRTDNYVPWMALTRNKAGASGDGLFAALDDLGTWTLGVDYAAGQGALTARFPALTNYSLAAGERLKLPLITLGVFDGDLDDMGRRVYDWQYTYLWDYTNSDYYARTKWATSWFFCSRNLQEQFAARLAGLDMDADLMRTIGAEMLWDDAGWSKYPGWPIADSYAVVFSPTYEGPDFAETLRYLAKMNMNWLLWMAGRPSAGLLDAKVGSWGNFQWRTDGFGRFGLKPERAIREQIEHFLQANPRCSFHTCCGGSRYAHQFEIQRYADVNYLSDMGRGDQTNHYLSYLELPDKWLDLIAALLEPNCKYNPATGPSLLSMAPGWYMRADGPEQEQLRRLMEVYRYLRQEGIAGRWSHMMHPAIRGDKDYYYDQRISYDAKKACIILKHRPEGEVTLYPKGLMEKQNYEVSYESKKSGVVRSGADLMTNGIVLNDTAPGELIYLGLPDMPGVGHSKTTPTAPGRAFTRRETNIGHSGIGVFWSPSGGDAWVSYYEVRRNAEVIGKASVGTYYFDHALGWDTKAAYAVRAVDGDGKASEWTCANSLAGGSDVYAALGGHFAVAGRDGWSAETTTDERVFTGMKWVAPTKSAAGDTGGTPNQAGGVEGYWEGSGQARVGRGWQQASPDSACVRTWTAPKAGTVAVVGRAMKECYHQAMGAPLHVRIQHNDKQVWPEHGWAKVALNDLQGVQHNFKVDVAAGDSLRFVVDRGVSPDTDIIAWMPRIVYSPLEPENGTTVRILCGAALPYRDHTGNLWSKDEFFAGGKAVSCSAAVSNALPTAEDGALYQRGRTGRDFTYTVPVTPGLYTLRLKFAETQYAWSFERPFNLSINGRRVLENFDICQSAHGAKRAYERVFHNLVANEKGEFVLRFTGGFEPTQKTRQAIVQAIEVLPETRPTVRIDAGSDRDFIDWNGFIWGADACFDGGAILRSDAPVAQASPTLYDQALYQTARSGRLVSYRVSAPPGVYTVHLKFAELWLKTPGQRPMTAEVNGRVVREHWDPAQTAGQIGMAADIRVEDVTPDKANEIVIRVSADGANDAILQGIEIE